MNYCRSTLFVGPSLGLFGRCRSARTFIQMTYYLNLRNETDHFRRKGRLGPNPAGPALEGRVFRVVRNPIGASRTGFP